MSWASYFRADHLIFNPLVSFFLCRPYNSPSVHRFRELFSPCIICVQYIGGCSVHQGVFSTPEGYHEYIGDIMSTSGDIMIHVGGYHEYIRGCSVHRGDIMSTLGDVQYIGGCSVHRSFQ